MKFYSVVLHKMVEIPEKDVVTKIKSGRRFYVGTYMANGKNYQAWRTAKSK